MLAEQMIEPGKAEIKRTFHAMSCLLRLQDLLNYACLFRARSVKCLRLI